MTSKQHILDEIIRTAKANGGVPLGQNRFENETGIVTYDWGKYWARWGDALREAGFQPNKFNSAYNDDILNEHLIIFMRELRKFPTKAELIVKRHSDPNFPSHNAFMRIGKRALASKLMAYCRLKGGLEDIAELCNAALEERDEGKSASATEKIESFGFVYLLKSGRHYKIGKTNAVGRRERELAIHTKTQKP